MRDADQELTSDCPYVVALKQKDPRRLIKHQKHSYHCIDIGIGTLAITARRRTRSSGPASATDCDTFNIRDTTELTMTVSFLPNDAGKFHMLVASTLQQEISRCSVYSISRLCVNRVLPADSYVFDVVREGQLDELKRMLREGEASIRDHDEYGASLLFVSTLIHGLLWIKCGTYLINDLAKLQYTTSQPETCKFLVDMGLDVDHLAIDIGADLDTNPKERFLW